MQKSARQEVKEKKRSAKFATLKTKAPKLVFVTVAGVCLVLLAYSSLFQFVNEHLANVPEFVPHVITGIFVGGLVFSLAYFTVDK